MTTKSMMVDLRSEPTARLLRIREVIHLTGLAKSSIWRHVKNGTFPAPFKLGPPGTKAVGWLSTEVADWIDGLRRWEGSEGPEGHQK